MKRDDLIFVLAWHYIGVITETDRFNAVNVYMYITNYKLLYLYLYLWIQCKFFNWIEYLLYCDDNADDNIHIFISIQNEIIRNKFSKKAVCGIYTHTIRIKMQHFCLRFATINRMRDNSSKRHNLLKSSVYRRKRQFISATTYITSKILLLHLEKLCN